MDLNIKNNEGFFALYETVMGRVGRMMDGVNQYEKSAKMLIANPDIDLNMQDNEGVTALLCSISMREKEIALLLIEAGADLNKQECTGETALMYSVRTRNYEVFDKLIEKGVDITLKNDKGETALDITELYYLRYMVEKLEEKCQKFETGNKNFSFGDGREGM